MLELWLLEATDILTIKSDILKYDVQGLKCPVHLVTTLMGKIAHDINQDLIVQLIIPQSHDRYQSLLGVGDYLVLVIFPVYYAVPEIVQLRATELNIIFISLQR